MFSPAQISKYKKKLCKLFCVFYCVSSSKRYSILKTRHNRLLTNNRL